MLDFLPQDWRDATLLGRINTGEGPTPVLIRDGRMLDVSAVAPTVSAFVDLWDGTASGRDLGELEHFSFEPDWEGHSGMRLLSPIDLQCIKAAGVTFAVSAVERVIEEHARGDVGKAQAIRDSLMARVGTDIKAAKPGSREAARLKDALIADGLWSQYLEVAIGPDAEIFTKAPVLSSVGWGRDIGVRSDSHWNNPEPEIVIICDSKGQARGATLGNDVNLR